MTRKWIITALAVAGIVPLTLGAQTPRPKVAPRARAYSYTLTDNRARIGVLVNRQANAESDKYGAKIDGVTPEGPADKAGLKAGDIITKFNGTSLAGVGGDNDEDSGPGAKLIELVSGLDVGDTVKVEYRRGSETKTATLVTDEQQGFVFSGPSMREFEMPRMQMPFMTTPDGQGGWSMCLGDAWCELDLVTLNSDLGDYFGTKEGVLVIKAPGDSTLPLKSGDVILSIGGRKPTSPAHAMRILRSYDAGESVSIEIMRHQRRQTLSWTVPQAGEMRRLRPSARPRGEQGVWRVPEAASERVRVAVERELQSALREQRASQVARQQGAMEEMQRRMETIRARLAKRMSTVAI